MKSFRARPPVRFSDLFDGALALFGVREHVNEGTSADGRCLTDGNNDVWVIRNDDGSAGFRHWPFLGSETTILDAVRTAFGVEVVLECEVELFGSETEEDALVLLDRSDPSKMKTRPM